MRDILINTYDTMAKILLVEDEINIASFIERGLREFGHEVYVAYDGAAGWELTQKNDFQLLILDIIMPKMNGLQLCKQYRQRFGYHAPVIMLTALGTTEDIVSGLDAGADDYVTKPFSPGEMMARVKVQLRKGMKIEKKAERILEADGLRMDTESCQVTVDGREVVLAGKEFWLLKFFMEHPGQVFTKAQIYHHVWEDGYEDDNTVMVYISKLREKLEDKPNERIWIQTIRGIGYRFGGSR